MKNQRDLNIDFLRGIVLILMTLDHVRGSLYPVSVGSFLITTTDPALFFTRVITHLCAPIFVFLAGISVFLNQKNHNYSSQEIAKFISKRGLFLILLEFTLISFFFNINYNTSQQGYILYAQVIWAIGASLIFLSLLILTCKKNYRLILYFSLTIIFCHNLFDIFTSTENIFWNFLHIKVNIPIIKDKLLIRPGYSLIPWVAVLSFGYALAALVYADDISQSTRKTYFRFLAFGSITLFIILRFYNLYGDSSQYTQGWMSFFNISKYPPSLQFLLATLSFAFLMLSLEIKQNKFIKIIEKFGKASLFFYILHLVVITASHQIFKMLQIKINSLSTIYFMAIFIAAISYYLIVKFIDFRKRNIDKRPWLSYI